MFVSSYFIIVELRQGLLDANIDSKLTSWNIITISHRTLKLISRFTTKFWFLLGSVQLVSDVSQFHALQHQQYLSASVGFDEYRNRKILSGKNPRQCNSCGKFFGSHSSLHRHKQMYHSNKELPQCNICGKRFSSLSNLGVHKISHTNARPFKCNQCSKTYKYKHDLKNHRCKVLEQTIWPMCWSINEETYKIYSYFYSKYQLAKGILFVLGILQLQMKLFFEPSSMCLKWIISCPIIRFWNCFLCLNL